MTVGGLPVAGLLEAGLDLRRARDSQPGRAACAILARLTCRAGHADHADAAVAQFEIGRRAFQEMGGDREDLLAQALARDGASPPTAVTVLRLAIVPNPIAIAAVSAKGEDDVLGRDLPEIGHDLGEDRLHALALRAGAARDVDLARRVDPDKGALERADAGALDIAADAEAEIAALAARLALAPPERLDAADRIERLLQGAGVIAAVVDDRLAVAIGDADPIRHLVGADHVAPPHLRRLQAQAFAPPGRWSAPSRRPLPGGRRRDRARSGPCW